MAKRAAKTVSQEMRYRMTCWVYSNLMPGIHDLLTDCDRKYTREHLVFGISRRLSLPYTSYIKRQGSSKSDSIARNAPENGAWLGIHIKS